MNSNEELEEMIRHLQTRMVYLEGRVALLEANRYTHGHQPKPQCSKCGMALNNVMGYVCADNYCPTFMKVTCTPMRG